MLYRTEVVLQLQRKKEWRRKVVFTGGETTGASRRRNAWRSSRWDQLKQLLQEQNQVINQVTNQVISQFTNQLINQQDRKIKQLRAPETQTSSNPV